MMGKEKNAEEKYREENEITNITKTTPGAAKIARDAAKEVVAYAANLKDTANKPRANKCNMEKFTKHGGQNRQRTRTGTDKKTIRGKEETWQQLKRR